MTEVADQTQQQCPWCGGVDTARIGDAGSLLMTEQWFCDGCSSAFEVIRQRGSGASGSSQGRGPIVSTGTTRADEDTPRVEDASGSGSDD